MKVKIEDIKKLREATGAGLADCRLALEQAEGEYQKALKLVQEWGFEKAAKKAERPVGAGLVETYVHAGGRVGAMVELACETDFVARTDEFKRLAHELALQVAAMDPKDVEELGKQEYIRDASKTINDLVKEVMARVGENIVIRRFIRFELGL